jgi:hypothetical protein
MRISLTTVSDKRPKSGWKLVEVSRKAVDSHEALLALWKYEVITG